ncbi:MauE/DoxX family redox-associated membrane protein [Nonomuraea sp. NPDC050404]|uniref:MauE/DoxX family redox-associated membrane protein n=1 Tax=Nonomuraea sp. NPDC050404 TaxID=3155783 RepID=UPI0033E1F082
MSVVTTGCQLSIAIVFAISAFTKLRTGAAFRSFVASLVMVPGPFRYAVAAVLAAGEVIVTVLAAGGVAAAVAVAAATPVPAWPRLGLALAGVLLVVLSAGIAVTRWRGLRVACRCFGRSETPLGGVHLVRNALLLVVVALGLSAPAVTGPLPVAGLAVAVPVALTTAVVLVFFDDIADLFVPGERT